MREIDLMITLPSTCLPDLEMKPVRPQLEMSFWKIWVGFSFFIVYSLYQICRGGPCARPTGQPQGLPLQKTPSGHLADRGEQRAPDFLGEVDEAEIGSQE